MTGQRQLCGRIGLPAAFLLMGFSFSISQTLLVRELLVTFAGNELTIGVVLGGWLALEALGSAVLGRRLAQTGHAPARYAALQVLLALLLLPVLAAAMGVRQLIGSLPGQGLGLPTTMLASILLLLPLGLVDGAMFTVGCRAAQEAPGRGDSAGRVYVAEAVGGIAGGLLFTLLCIPYLSAVQTALLLAALNLGSALSLVGLQPLGQVAAARRPRRRLAQAALWLTFLLCLGILLSPAAAHLEQRLVTWQWQPFHLVYSDDSAYGNVAAIGQLDQLTFFANGVPIITAPVPDIARVEELVHLPMLFVPHPESALVLSGGVGGVLHELLKYPLQRVDYAELDPLILEAVTSLPTALTTAELADPRVHTALVDGRLLVRRLAAHGEGSPRAAARYDVILVNLPTPTTLQINRFYTVEFWQMVDELLDDDGLAILQAPGSLTHLSPGMRSLHRSLWATLTQVFPHVRPIPGDATLWLASRALPLETTATDTTVQRWRARQIASALITEPHIRERLDDRWLTWFWGSLERSAGTPAEAVNRDLHPTGLLDGLAYWNELFSPRLMPYFDALRRLRLPTLAVPMAAAALVDAVALRWRRGWRSASLPIAIAATGFGGMAADLLIIFAFQVFHGHVYQLIGLLLAAFMAGLSLGGWLTARRGSRAEQGAPHDRRFMLGLEAALLLFWLALPGALTLLNSPRVWQGASWAVTPALLSLNVLAGLLVGAQFPLANRLYRRAQPDVAAAAGRLYAADLIGAFLAALLVSAVLVPALGVVQTCLLVALLKAGSLALVAVSGSTARS